MKELIGVVLELLSEMREAPLNGPIHLAFSFDADVGCLGASLMSAEILRSGLKPRGCIVGERSTMQLIVAHTDEAGAVMAKMRETPVNDAFAKGGIIRPDGRLEHDMYLMRVKKPSESKAPWDYTTFVATIPGAQATRPLVESDCPLVKNKK